MPVTTPRQSWFSRADPVAPNRGFPWPPPSASRSLYTALAALGVFRLAAWATSRRFRILTYHGLYTGCQAGNLYIPPSFVRLEEFERQMRIVRKWFRPIRLADAIRTLASGGLPPRGSIAVTFDDGYESSFTLAGPVLQRYGIPATVYVCTGLIGTEELLSFDKLALLQRWASAAKIDLNVPSNKHLPVHCQRCWLLRTWPAYERLLTPEQAGALRLASWETIREAQRFGIEAGAHTVHHAILGNEIDSVRRREIMESAECVRRFSPSGEATFSYPNGQRSNFSALDQQMVRDSGCCGAVCGIRGLNGRKADVFALKRLNVGQWHTGASFKAEICGFRTLVKRVQGRTAAPAPQAGDDCPLDFPSGVWEPAPLLSPDNIQSQENPESTCPTM